MNVSALSGAVQVLQKEKHVFKGIELQVRAAPLPQGCSTPIPSLDKDSSPDKDSTESAPLQDAKPAEASGETFHDTMASCHEDPPNSKSPDDLMTQPLLRRSTEMKRDLSSEGISGGDNKQLKTSHPASVHDKGPHELGPGSYQGPGSMGTNEGPGDRGFQSLSSVKQLRGLFERNQRSSAGNIKSYQTPTQSSRGHQQLGQHKVSPDRDLKSHRNPTVDQNPTDFHDPHDGDGRHGSRDRSYRGPASDQSSTGHDESRQSGDSPNSTQYQDPRSHRSLMTDGGLTIQQGRDYEGNPDSMRDGKHLNPTPDRTFNVPHRPHYEDSPEGDQRSSKYEQDPNNTHHGPGHSSHHEDFKEQDSRRIQDPRNSRSYPTPRHDLHDDEHHRHDCPAHDHPEDHHPRGHRDPYDQARRWVDGSPAHHHHEPEPHDLRRYSPERSRGSSHDRGPRETSGHHQAPADFHDDNHDHQKTVHKSSTGKFTEDYPSSLKGPSLPKEPGYVRVPDPSQIEEPTENLPCAIVVGNIPPGTSEDILISFLENKRHTNVTEVKTIELKGKKALVTLSTVSGK